MVQIISLESEYRHDYAAADGGHGSGWYWVRRDGKGEESGQESAQESFASGVRQCWWRYEMLSTYTARSWRGWHGQQSRVGVISR